jgi:hypothetical protein
VATLAVAMLSWATARLATTTKLNPLYSPNYYNYNRQKPRKLLVLPVSEIKNPISLA